MVRVLASTNEGSVRGVWIPQNRTEIGINTAHNDIGKPQTALKLPENFWILQTAWFWKTAIPQLKINIPPNRTKNGAKTHHQNPYVPSPMWPWFKSQLRRHMWVELVVGLPCSERFFPGTPVFPTLLQNQLYSNCTNDTNNTCYLVYYWKHWLSKRLNGSAVLTELEKVMKDAYILWKGNDWASA